jgi:hypothetical protein
MTRLSSKARILKYGDPTKHAVAKQVVPLRIVVPSVGLSVHTSCHISVRTRLLDAVVEASIATEWVPTEMQAYNVRAIRGGVSWSLHSWALAWDCFGSSGPIDPITGRHRPPDKWFEALEAHGFTWGGRWRKPDPHHFEWST